MHWKYRKVSGPSYRPPHYKAHSFCLVPSPVLLPVQNESAVCQLWFTWHLNGRKSMGFIKHLCLENVLSPTLENRSTSITQDMTVRVQYLYIMCIFRWTVSDKGCFERERTKPGEKGPENINELFFASSWKLSLSSIIAAPNIISCRSRKRWLLVGTIHLNVQKREDCRWILFLSHLSIAVSSTHRFDSSASLPVSTGSTPMLVST